MSRLFQEQIGFRLETVDSFAEIREEWQGLAESAGNPFMTPEWCEAWLGLGCADCEPRVLAARRPDGSLAALVPLVVTRGRYVRKARFLGFGASGELGPVCAPEDLELGARALRGALDQIRSEWDVFVAERLPGEGWDERLGGVVMECRGGPVVRGPWESWDAYLASRSRDFRQELRRKERRLQERGLEYRTVTDRSELAPALDTLFRLHRAFWGERAGPWFAGAEELHRAFAEVALERGWLRLRLLELEGRTAAVYLGYRFGETEWAYQFGRDTSDERCSVGAVMAGHAVRCSIEEGATLFKLGPGTQEYKRRLATDDPGLQTIGQANSLRGRAALHAASRRPS